MALVETDVADLLAEMGFFKVAMMMDLQTYLVAVPEVADDGAFRIEGLEAGAYTLLILVDNSSYDAITYVFTTVTVTESQETNVKLGPDFVTEYAEERQNWGL